MTHPLYDYGPPVVVKGSGSPAVTTGEVEPGTSTSPHTPPANTGTVIVAGGSPTFESGLKGPAPTVTSLNPNTAVVGGANLTMTVTGTGFTEDTAILFNNGVENTTFISATQVSTTVKPSLASGAGVVPVGVQNGATKSNTVNFAFTATG